jgi:hypothetical protein
MKRKDWRRIIITLAGPEIAAGGASAPSVLDVCSNLRTTTNGVRGGEARHGQMPFGRYRLEGPVTVAEGGTP